MHGRTLPVAALALGALLFGPGAARAQEDKSPVRAAQEPPRQASRGAPEGAPGYPLFSPYYDQPIVVPPWMLALSVTGSVMRVPGEPASYELGFGALYGLAPHLHVEAVFAPVQLSPEVRYGNPRLGFVYGLVETLPIDVGAKVSATLNTGPTGNLIAPLSAGVPVAVRMGGSLRIDAGAFVNVGLGKKENEKNTMGLSVPVSPSVQIAPPIAVAVDTGFSIADLHRAGDTAVVPLGFSVVSSIDLSRKHGFFVSPFFAWPVFLTPAAEASVHTDLFVAGMYFSSVIDFDAEPE